MRVRLSSKPPLTIFKVWYDITEGSALLDIGDLKKQLCGRLPQLSAEGGGAVQPETLKLYIDDFELLDDSRISILRENDIVW